MTPRQLASFQDAQLPALPDLPKPELARRKSRSEPAVTRLDAPGKVLHRIRLEKEPSGAHVEQLRRARPRETSEPISCRVKRERSTGFARVECTIWLAGRAVVEMDQAAIPVANSQRFAVRMPGHASRSAGERQRSDHPAGAPITDLHQGGEVRAGSQQRLGGVECHAHLPREPGG